MSCCTSRRRCPPGTPPPYTMLHVPAVSAARGEDQVPCREHRVQPDDDMSPIDGPLVPSARARGVTSAGMHAGLHPSTHISEVTRGRIRAWHRLPACVPRGVPMHARRVDDPLCHEYRQGNVPRPMHPSCFLQRRRCTRHMKPARYCQLIRREVSKALGRTPRQAGTTP